MNKPSPLVVWLTRWIVWSLIILLIVFTLIQNSQSREYIPVACTEEAKICPDGSAVGRGGPDCEFAPCPVSSGAVGPGIDVTAWKNL